MHTLCITPVYYPVRYFGQLTERECRACIIGVYKTTETINPAAPNSPTLTALPIASSSPLRVSQRKGVNRKYGHARPYKCSTRAYDQVAVGLSANQHWCKLRSCVPEWWKGCCEADTNPNWRGWCIFNNFCTRNCGDCTVSLRYLCMQTCI